MPEKFGSGLRLLLVEDDARTLGDLQRIFKAHTGFEIGSASRALEAIGLSKECPFDLALIDIRLPGMDGLTLLDELKAITPELLAVIMTGYREETTAKESRDRGAVDFIEKPLDLPYMLSVLRQQSRECLVRRELRASVERLKGVLAHIGDGIALVSQAGDVVVCNAAGERLLQNRDAVEGARVEHGGRVFELSRSLVGGESLLHWRDLTASLEIERGRAYRQMGRLLAHELLNPLTPMKLWLQDIKALPAGSPDLERFCREGIDIVLEQVGRLSRLVREFKALGCDGPLEIGPVPVGKPLAEAAEALRPMAKRAGVTLRVDPGDSPVVKADEGAVYQVVFNLLKNSIEAHEQREGGVTCTAAAKGSTVVITVRDEGGGLSEKVASQLFRPYLTTKPDGTGLGLLVCKELLGRMGSSLDIRNRPDGIGVEASFSLELVPGAAGQP